MHCYVVHFWHHGAIGHTPIETIKYARTWVQFGSTNITAAICAVVTAAGLEIGFTDAIIRHSVCPIRWGDSVC